MNRTLCLIVFPKTHIDITSISCSASTKLKGRDKFKLTYAYSFFGQFVRLTKLVTVRGWKLTTLSRILKLHWTTMGRDMPSTFFLLCKQFMHSSSLTQQPTLILPFSRLSKLSAQPTKILQRNKLSDRQLNEFRKTARLIAQPPWSLISGAQYLNALCDDNESGRIHAPPTLIHFNTSAEVLAGLQAQRDIADPPEELLNFAPGTPRKVVANLAPRPPRPAAARGRGRARGRQTRGRGRGRGEGPNADSVADGEKNDEPCVGGDNAAGSSGPVPPEEEPHLPDLPHGDDEELLSEERLDPPSKKRPAAAQAEAVFRRPASAKAPKAAAKAAPKAVAAVPPAAAKAKVSYRQSTIDQQSQLGRSKCWYASAGCARCREIHKLWKEQNGHTD